jgi:hypothetical protein
MASRVESCETILQHLRSKLEGVRAKYSKDWLYQHVYTIAISQHYIGEQNAQ